MHNNAPHPTSSWPQAPTAGAAMLHLLVAGLEKAGQRAQQMQSTRLHIQDTPPPALSQLLSRHNPQQDGRAA